MARNDAGIVRYHIRHCLRGGRETRKAATRGNVDEWEHAAKHQIARVQYVGFFEIDECIAIRMRIRGMDQPNGLQEIQMDR